MLDRAAAAAPKAAIARSSELLLEPPPLVMNSASPGVNMKSSCRISTIELARSEVKASGAGARPDGRRYAAALAVPQPGLITTTFLTLKLYLHKCSKVTTILPL